MDGVGLTSIMIAVNTINCDTVHEKRGKARQGEPCGGHLQNHEKYIMQRDH